RFALGENRARGLTAQTRFTYRKQALTLRFDGNAADVATPVVTFARLGSEGTLRARAGFARIAYEGSVSGTGVAFGPALDSGLAKLQTSAGETMLAPLLRQMRGAMAREARGSRLAAEVDYRRERGRFTLYVSEATLRGGSGAELVALSRVSLRSGSGAPRFAGDFVTGGPGLPRITGRTERADASRTVLRLTLDEYRAGAAALALPDLVVTQAGDGSLGFVGKARASGPLPGGFARNLSVPLDGSLASNGALALFRRCATLRFDQLAYASLTLERRAVTLCPQRGEAIVRAGTGGLRIAAGAPSLDLAGRFGQSPVRLVSGPIGFAYPGVISARDVTITLGRAAAPNRFSLAKLEGRIGEQVSSGTFAGAEARLYATPLDITRASGNWRYTPGRVDVTDAALQVTDRVAPARFEPLEADGATLTLVGNRLEAVAALRHAATDRPITRALLRHDLASGRGSADLAVDALRFDEGFQPAQLTRLALGTIANVRGEVAGTGRIDWTPGGVTSTGTFSTEALDFAAAFGPVSGLSGTVRFTDLLNMVTAPDQEVRIASLNPGVEVSEGVVRFELLRGNVFRLKSAQWPFLGGTLSLAPIDLNLGVSEARRYTLIIDGLDAARFVERMGLANISATGIFDGRLPLVFAAGSGTEQLGAAVGTLVGIGTTKGVEAAASTPGSGRIEGGILTSRPPGGNVSYVGELTKRDLSTMANFAFQTLRSLDYRAMTIELNGALEGEIVTRVSFDGVRQGEGAKRNILTRAIADIPIKMIINIRAPFYQLLTSMKALYDPAFTKDPRVIGLLDEKGKPIPRSKAPQPPTAPTPPAVQPQASEKKP
ncbi:MAG: YdbH domain-containing protein, partial [Novosphingobium sp.]